MIPVRDSPDLAAVRDALVAADRVVITTHLRPDGDALGTEIAIGRALRAMGKMVTILNADRVPRNQDWLAEEQPDGLLNVYESGDLGQAEAVAHADALLVVDANAEHRLGDVGGVFRKSGKPIYLLDHHPDPEGWFDAACVRTDAAAAAEIAYDLIAGIDPELIGRAVATALYVGIMTDTGSFRYSATTPRTHAVIADVLERGDLRPEPIHVSIFDGRSREGLALLSAALGTITTHYDGRLATMFVTQDMIRSSGAFFDETEGLINYGLSLDGVLAAVIFLELPSGVKLSFRSKGDCPINGWATKFGGGGHANASGAFVKDGQLARTIKDVVDAAPRHVAVDPHVLANEEEHHELSADDLALLAQFGGSR
jgi:phosphoesterase RecJ-like protein